MVAGTVPEAVGAVVVVAPWYLLLVFSGVCATVPTVPIFYVDPA